MQEAADLFLDFHDYASFADKRRDKDASTAVLVNHISLTEHGDLIVLRIVASHFLWKMVRRIMGILVEVGRGYLDKRDVLALFASKSDLPAKFTAPPSGLFLEKVFYQKDVRQELSAPEIPFVLIRNKTIR
jgi:tRNA pseudouridine38-40 synthase